jgi:hypothetical protein
MIKFEKGFVNPLIYCWSIRSFGALDLQLKSEVEAVLWDLNLWNLMLIVDSVRLNWIMGHPTNVRELVSVEEKRNAHIALE